MSPRVKKAGLIFVDLCLVAYLVLAVSAFNKPEEKLHICKNVNITVEDQQTNGFINANEIKTRLEKSKLYPKGKSLSSVSCRQIEDMLKQTPFVKSAECYKTQEGDVNIHITQRLPILRIKSYNNEDYYIDDKDCIMPNSDYTSDLIIATGFFHRDYATAYVSPLARALMEDDVCRNLFEQINITNRMEVELVPRIGNHIVMLGRLPMSNSKSKRQELISEFVKTKMNRLKLFYKYGLPQAGWNKYSEINLEFDNQIICKRIDDDEEEE